ncbi:MAG: PD-(D/E)XK nuclease family protein [candidate division Zixibacteria bacterium]|nr:PD-(D/E)XK nuclease family protein [Candidatus Tariuqbacter arcticus]
MHNQKEKIYKFLINNEKLELLQSQLNEFNPFKVLRIEDHEIRHSNVLAWLFCPSENHNLDDRILKKFLLSVVAKPDNEDILEESIHLLDLQQANYLDAEVYREEDHIDLLIISKKNRLAIIIENKIFSKEHTSQLNRYLEMVKSKYHKNKILPIYLTFEGDRPSNLNYCSASYHDVFKVIDFNIKLYKNRITSYAFDFIQFYLKILKEKIIMDENLKKLCRSIYKENKDAIDLIYSIGNEIDIFLSIEDFKDKFPDIEIIWSSNKNFCFLLQEFKVSKQISSNWAGGHSIAYWFLEYYGKLKIILEIGPFDDSEHRVKFLEKIEDKGISISKRAKEPGRLNTIIYSATEKIDDWTNRQEISDKMIKLFSKRELRNIKEKLLNGIREFDWEK